MRYEMIGYVESMATGEEIRLAHPLQDRDLVDFWLFDAGTQKAFAVLMHYNNDGVVLGYEPVDKRAELVALAAVRDLVWSRSWTLAEQLARKPA